ncbi:MAG: ABC transporter ATP-binding protein [Roseiflexaceae bacterium]
MQASRNLWLDYLSPQRLRLLLLTVLLLSSTGAQLAGPQVLRMFIDTATTGGAFQVLLWIALAYLGVGLLSQVLAVLTTYTGNTVGWAATNQLRADLAAHCLRLDMPFHNARTPGEMIERIDGDVTVLSNFFSLFLFQVIGNLLLLVGVLIALFAASPLAGAVLTGFALLSLLVLNRVRGATTTFWQADRQASATLLGFVEERLAGVADIRTSGAVEYMTRRFYQLRAGQFLTGRRARVLSEIIFSSTNVLLVVGYVTAFALSAYLYSRNEITIGTVLLITTYIELLLRPLRGLVVQADDFQKASASLNRVDELLGMRPQVQDGPGAPLPDGPLEVECAGVSFAYNPGELTLDQITFRLEPGRVLGLLGRTGSGKTTLTRLLVRFYDPTSGTIRLGGQDLRQLRLHDLWGRIGVVTQEVQLFGASVRDNLTMFDPHIPDETITALLQEIGLGEWLTRLPQGLDTPLASGGSGLSAGEAQLLAFARVFLHNPGLVILDEASSRLDPATERLIEQAIRRLLQGRTALVIAHRLRSVQLADDIMVLERGRIVEYGQRTRLAQDPASRFAQLLQTGLEEVLA